ELINNGLINKTWLVKNGRKNYILQRVNDNIFKTPEAIASNVRTIADYLKLHCPDYLFVAPEKTIQNTEMKFVEGEGYYRLLPYVEDSKTINTVQNTGQANEAAKKFGEFTMLLSNFPVEQLQITLPDFHDLSLRYQQFCNALQNGNCERIKQSEAAINFIKENKIIVDVYEQILKNKAFKKRVTHHDTKISNVLFSENDKGICVIDLDTVMPGYFISDVGDMFRTYLSPANEEEIDFSKIEIREDYFKAIWDGYMSEMGSELSAEEKAHFIYAGKFMIYMQAIRFLTDHLNNDVYYGAAYPDHNFMRACNQVTLLERLMEKETILNKMIDL
ncbi:MAG: aminoglycoside phosphotransferase family protein, partial [Ferruginibacter sp.]